MSDEDLVFEPTEVASTRLRQQAEKTDRMIEVLLGLPVDPPKSQQQLDQEMAQAVTLALETHDKWQDGQIERLMASGCDEATAMRVLLQRVRSNQEEVRSVLDRFDLK
jgi:uncharacterized protein YoaH (UPF0181 family)